LLCSLKDDALTFATKLPEAVQSDINTLYSALNQRYGDHLLPEQYRENLNQVRKLPTESLSEYACRVGDLVNKAESTGASDYSHNRAHFKRIA
jgi:hypothetical protein